MQKYEFIEQWQHGILKSYLHMKEICSMIYLQRFNNKNGDEHREAQRYNPLDGHVLSKVVPIKQHKDD